MSTDTAPMGDADAQYDAVNDPSKWQEVPLWGGAFKVNLPNDFFDVSKFRKIPDNQEVHSHHIHPMILHYNILLMSTSTSLRLFSSISLKMIKQNIYMLSRSRSFYCFQVHMSAKDQSVIFELDQPVDGVDDDNVGRFHFDQLALEMDAKDPEVVNTGNIDLTNINSLSHQLVSLRQFVDGRLSVGKYKEDAQNIIRIHMSVFRLPSVKTDLLIIINWPLYVAPTSAASQLEGERSTEVSCDDVVKMIWKSLKAVDLSMFT